MKTTINFPKDLVKKEYNSAVVSALVSTIVVGVMLIISHNIIDFKDDSTMSMLVTCGIFAVVVAAAVLSFSMKHQVVATSGNALACKIIEFHESEYSRVEEAVADGRWADINQLAKEGNGVAMRLEVVYTKDKDFAAYQFFKYVPHSYEACSDITYLAGADIASVFKIDR